jgi:hypothetical protein
MNEFSKTDAGCLILDTGLSCARISPSIKGSSIKYRP